MGTNRRFWLAVFTCSRTFFLSMVLPLFVLTIISGISVIDVLLIPTVTALIFGGFLAGPYLHLSSKARGGVASFLLGGFFGVTNLLLSTLLYGLVRVYLLSDPYFDVLDASHWQELLAGPFILAGIPMAYAFVFLTTAVGGVLFGEACKWHCQRKTYETYLKFGFPTYERLILPTRSVQNLDGHKVNVIKHKVRERNA